MTDPSKRCAECEQIITEMRAAFAKLMDPRRQGDLPTRRDFNQFLSQLFSSEAAMTRLQEQWHQSESGAVYLKWMEHRIATGHTPVLRSATGSWGTW
jgi:hypothetical protein